MVVFEEDEEVMMAVMQNNASCKDENELIKNLKDLRKKCFESVEYQLEAIKYRLHLYILDTIIIKQIMQPAEDRRHDMVLQLAIQTLVNMITCNENARSLVWKDFLQIRKAEISKLIEYTGNTKDTAILIPLLVLLINSLKNNCSMEQKKDILSLIFNQGSVLAESLLFPTCLDGNENDEMGEVDHLKLVIWTELISSGLHEFYLNLILNYSVDLSPIVSHLADEHVRMQLAIITLQTYSNHTDNLALIRTCRTLLERLSDYYAAENDKEGHEITDAHMMNELKELLQTLVDFLSHFSRNNPISTAKSTNTSSKDDDKKGVKCMVIMIITNLVHKYPEFQDTMRQIDGIPLILDHCNIDDNNPYMKEWSVFCIRNLCIGNVENQNFLRQLKFKSTAVDQLGLENAGIEVSVQNDKVSLQPHHPKRRTQ